MLRDLQSCSGWSVGRVSRRSFMRGTFNRSFHRAYLWLAAAVIAFLCAAGSATVTQAAIGDRYNINVQGTLKYTDTWTLLAKINALRTEKKLDGLAMDDSLMASAMQRAAEISCFYQNELRPNQQDPLLINAKAEASVSLRGCNTVDEAFEELKKNDDAVAKMESSTYKSVGIGCFIVDSRYHWVLLFSSQAGTPKAHVNTSKTVTLTVTELGAFNQPVAVINNKRTSELSLYAGNTAAVTVRWKDSSNRGLSTSVYTTVDPKSFTWKSSKKSVASVNSSGKITAKKAGTATITAVPKVKSGTVEGLSIKVTVNKNGFKATVEDAPYTWSGGAIKPAVTVNKVTDSGAAGELLTGGVDYTITYKSNKNVGYGEVIVTGKGTYANQTETLKFKIRPSKMKTLKVSSTTAGTMRLTWKTNVQATGYQIQIATSSDMKTDSQKKTVAAGKLKLTVKNLKSGTTYYVRIRPYTKVSDTERFYGKWSSKKKVTVK